MREFTVSLLVLSGTLMLIFGFTAAQRRSSSVAKSFAAVALCAVVWDYGFAGEIISQSLDGKILWANIQFLGITFLPVAWFAMTLHSTGQPRQAFRLIPALIVVPLLTNILIWSNPIHHLFRGSPMISTSNASFPVLVNDYGTLFFAVHIPYGYFLFAASLFILFHSLKKTASVYLRQRIILLLSLLIPLSVDFLYVLGITPIPAFNFTPVFFSFSGFLIGRSVLNFHFLDILSLAYEAAIYEMDAGLIVVDALERVAYINPSAEQITGLLSNQAIGVATSQIFPFLEPLWDSASGRVEATIPRGSEEHIFQLNCSKMMGRRKRLIGQVITLHDITERVRLHRQVEAISITDPLTGALNRRALSQRGEQEILRARRYQRNLSLILLDADNFKTINDTFGHQTGDKVLVSIVHILKQHLRANDQVYRYGGDEFIALLPETALDDAQATARRIQEGITAITIGGQTENPPAIEVSLGIASLAPEDTLDTLFSQADQALYQAKQAGKNLIVVSTD